MIGNHVDEVTVAAALDRSLPLDDAHAVFEHVVRCDACRERFAGVIEADLWLSESAAELRPRNRPRRRAFARRAALALAALAAAVMVWVTIARDERPSSQEPAGSTEPAVATSPVLDAAAARAAGFSVHELAVTKFECDRSGRMTETFRLDASGTQSFTYRYESSIDRDDEIVVRSVKETLGDRP